MLKPTFLILGVLIFQANISSAYDKEKVKIFTGLKFEIQVTTSYQSQLGEPLNFPPAAFFAKSIVCGIHYRRLICGVGIGNSVEVIHGVDEDGSKNPITYFNRLETNHVFLPINLALRFSENKVNFLFLQASLTFDYVTRMKMQNQLLFTTYNKFALYREFYEFGVGFNFHIWSKLKMQYLFSYSRAPLLQRSILGEDFMMEKVNNSICTYWEF